jgi:hypothetical protein
MNVRQLLFVTLGTARLHIYQGGDKPVCCRKNLYEHGFVFVAVTRMCHRRSVARTGFRSEQISQWQPIVHRFRLENIGGRFLGQPAATIAAILYDCQCCSAAGLELSPWSVSDAELQTGDGPFFFDAAFLLPGRLPIFKMTFKYISKILKKWTKNITRIILMFHMLAKLFKNRYFVLKETLPKDIFLKSIFCVVCKDKFWC